MTHGGGATAEMTGHPLISAEKVQGTAVYNLEGDRLGHVEDLMLHKLSGTVAFAIMSFGGFLGMGEEYHVVPWQKLTYDTTLGGYRSDITESQLREAPAFSRDRDDDWSDRDRERELHDYWRSPYYWDKREAEAGRI